MTRNLKLCRFLYLNINFDSFLYPLWVEFWKWLLVCLKNILLEWSCWILHSCSKPLYYGTFLRKTPHGEQSPYRPRSHKRTIGLDPTTNPPLRYNRIWEIFYHLYPLYRLNFENLLLFGILVHNSIWNQGRNTQKRPRIFNIFSASCGKMENNLMHNQSHL